MDAVIMDQISKRFGTKTVLNQVSLNIEQGSICGLIGPSGAGKTTLVKMMVGMEVPDGGTIRVLDRSMPNLPVLQEIGYMAQSDALYGELTGAENLNFFASLYQLRSAERKQRLAYAAGLVNLSGELGKKVSAYSGGMKRRLSLAIALLHDPPLLILDEPTVGIDPELRQSIWHELLRLKEEESKTIIVTTHVMDEAERCGVLGMIRDGNLLTAGSPGELKAQYGAGSLEEVFIKAGGKHA